jgi:pilus assembly protein CpaC
MTINCTASTSYKENLEIVFRCLLATLIFSTLLIYQNPSLAADLESQISLEGGSSTLRLGLNKSAIITLPGDARDVIVGNQEIVDAVVRMKSVIYLFAKKVGQTNVFFFDKDGRKLLDLNVEVAVDKLALEQLVSRTIPGGHVLVDSVNDSVVLKGTVNSGADMQTLTSLAGKFTGDPEKVVNTVTILEGAQVLIKVKVVEIQKTLLKQIGVNLDNLAFDVGNFAINLSTSNPVSSSYSTGSSSLSSGSIDFKASVKALEEDGLITILAEPNLTAISGQSAKFLAGGQFPYRDSSTCDSNGKNCAITYKDYGVKLNFSPTVLDERRISIKIMTEVSEVSDSSTGTLQTRSTETVLELPSGGSMMMGGLIKETNSHTLDGTPGLKDVPVLGTLFRSKEFRNNKTELAVIVTAYIVKPVHDSSLATPLDARSKLLDALRLRYGSKNDTPTGEYSGDIGFIIE